MGNDMDFDENAAGQMHPEAETEDQIEAEAEAEMHDLRDMVS